MEWMSFSSSLLLPSLVSLSLTFHREKKEIDLGKQELELRQEFSAQHVVLEMSQFSLKCRKEEKGLTLFKMQCALL